MYCHRTCSLLIVYQGKRQLSSPRDFEDLVILPDGAASKLPPNENYLAPFWGTYENAAGCAPVRPLETCPVNLVAGLLRRQAAVRAFGCCAVIDDTVDFASDRHGKAVLLSELHDDAGSLDALGDRWSA
jgi:hypothetical protein